MTSISIFNNASEAQQLLKIIDKREFALVWDEETFNTAQLELLTISSCRLTTLAPLFNVSLKCLTTLNLCFNRITDISHLAHLDALSSLDISHNRIISIEPLRRMANLTTLRCHHNAIESLEPIMQSRLLTELWIADNKLDWLEFIYLMPLINLSHLVKFGNPADTKAKIDQFLWATCATLQTLDGLEYASSNSGFPTALDSSPLDFLRTTDGKIMLTQAKAQLTPALRAKLLPFVERINLYAEGEMTQQQQGSPYHERAALRNNNNYPNQPQRHVSPSPVRYTQDDVALGNKSHQNHQGHQGKREKAREEERRLGFQRMRPARVHIYKAPKSSQEPQTKPPRKYPQGPVEALQGSLSDPALEHMRPQPRFYQQQLQTQDEEEREGEGEGEAEVEQERLRSPPVATFQADVARNLKLPHDQQSPKPQRQVQQQQQQQPEEQEGQLEPQSQQRTLEQMQAQTQRALQQLQLAASHGAEPSSSDATSPASQSHKTSPSPQQTKKPPPRSEPNTGYPPTTQIIRFGDAPDAPVALCLDQHGPAQGNGYARWSKNGPVCCSFENGRIFSSYKNGAIAVVLDKDCNGSIMNPKGKCVCIVNSNGTAKVMDKNGNTIAEHRQHQLGGESDDPASSSASAGHSWKFDGLQLDFLPATWEILVKFSNERVSCEFSSRTGGRLLRDIVAEKREREREKERERAAAGGAGVGSDGHSREPDHDSLRSGLASITSNLNDMMSGLKAREPLPPAGKGQGRKAPSGRPANINVNATKQSKQMGLVKYR